MGNRGVFQRRAQRLLTSPSIDFHPEDGRGAGNKLLFLSRDQGLHFHELVLFCSSFLCTRIRRGARRQTCEMRSICMIYEHKRCCIPHPWWGAWEQTPVVFVSKTIVYAALLLHFFSRCGSVKLTAGKDTKASRAKCLFVSADTLTLSHEKWRGRDPYYCKTPEEYLANAPNSSLFVWEVEK